MRNDPKRVVFYFPHLLLIMVVACTATDRQRPTTPSQMRVQDEPATTWPCQQVVLRTYNGNRYAYRFGARQRLSQCTALEQTNMSRVYALNQQLSYTKDGLLEQVRDGEDSSRYLYRNGRLAAILFFQEGQPVYRYLITTNDQGQIMGLRGMPFNDSGLLACSTRYRLDKQGRYVQLDVDDGQGVRYYRMKQGDFVRVTGHLYELTGSLPYDLNRYSWLSWAEVFPLSPYLAKHVETFKYAAPETPTQLIKRTDLSITWQRNKRGYITGQFSTDALTTLRDTIRIDYINCP